MYDVPYIFFAILMILLSTLAAWGRCCRFSFIAFTYFHGFENDWKVPEKIETDFLLWIFAPKTAEIKVAMFGWPNGSLLVFFVYLVKQISLKPLKPSKLH